MMKTIKYFILLTVIISIGSPLMAKDFYVSPTGSGSSYTLAVPGSITSAMSAAAPGDTVYCLDGRYTKSSSSAYSAFYFATSGAAGKPITLKSYNLHKAVFVRRTLGTPAIGMENRNYIVIDGIKTEGMILFSTSHHSTVKNCEVTGGSMPGYDSYKDTSCHWGISIQDSDRKSVV